MLIMMIGTADHRRAPWVTSNPSMPGKFLARITNLGLRVWIKSNAVAVLTGSYTNETQALQTIATTLTSHYPKDARIRPASDAVQKIYSGNFFPEMKADWSSYPDNIGHFEWPGCFRCHDGLHKTADGSKEIKASDCNSCHTLLAQGSGEDLNKLNPGGMTFAHPGDELDETPTCHECHTGGL